MSSKQLEGLLNVYFQCHESYLFENWMMEEDLSAHSKMASSWDALPWYLSLTPHHANLTAPLQPTTTTLRSRNKKQKCPANHRQSEHLIPTFFFSTGSSHMPNCQTFSCKTISWNLKGCVRAATAIVVDVVTKLRHSKTWRWPWPLQTQAHRGEGHRNLRRAQGATEGEESW